MDRVVIVYVELQGTTYLVGRLWARTRKDRESTTLNTIRTGEGDQKMTGLETVYAVGPAGEKKTADTRRKAPACFDPRK
jgi:hypothetical protein